ncbi:type II toxin-antitoxin system VapC family toxin [Sphingomonas aracearum]|uniref:Ribonuclease VapC n=1 Tax=Sphingomonas aracearum TaxID=2283317 RepID=A0A369VX04_9SPHN|nr:type II toxin-antitoxin system VapC family toxin [Sphingomonas aracearum]RDE06914.1 type II toxin-antitoxin system VapC family toxin [Sphingomonas aracearum]
MKLFVDASAIVAIIAGEEGADELALRLDRYGERLTSPVARWEAIVGLHRSHHYDWRYAEESVDALLHLQAVRMTAIGEREGQLALNAFGNYGKGKHPARLNMGDCFAYGCASAQNADLLFKGDDFSKTDLGTVNRA